MRSLATGFKKEGKTVGLVPTMGYFHEGHLSLMRRARQQNDIVVVSIYVNPLQFGPKEDYKEYPRDLDRDKALAEGVGVDVIFAPSDEEMYFKDHSVFVDEVSMTDVLCGKSRPGHFRGVLTVVAKLFNIVLPDRAYFGMKDYQQLKIIERMVRDLNFPVEIVPCPIVREEDGLAMSSRNIYLTPEERKSALSLSRSLKMAKELIEKEGIDADKIKKMIVEEIKKYPYTKIDYVEIVDADSLKPLTKESKKALIALAVFVGKARLIDNTVVDIKH